MNIIFRDKPQYLIPLISAIAILAVYNANNEVGPTVVSSSIVSSWITLSVVVSGLAAISVLSPLFDSNKSVAGLFVCLAIFFCISFVFAFKQLEIYSLVLSVSTVYFSGMAAVRLHGSQGVRDTMDVLIPVVALGILTWVCY